MTTDFWWVVGSIALILLALAPVVVAVLKDFGYWPTTDVAPEPQANHSPKPQTGSTYNYKGAAIKDRVYIVPERPPHPFDEALKRSTEDVARAERRANKEFDEIIKRRTNGQRG